MGKWESLKYFLHKTTSCKESLSKNSVLQDVLQDVLQGCKTLSDALQTSLRGLDFTAGIPATRNF